MSIIYANLAHFVTVSLPTRRTASAATIIGHSNMCDKDKFVILMYCTTVSLSLALFLSRSFSLALSLWSYIWDRNESYYSFWAFYPIVLYNYCLYDFTDFLTACVCPFPLFRCDHELRTSWALIKALISLWTCFCATQYSLCLILSIFCIIYDSSYLFKNFSYFLPILVCHSKVSIVQSWNKISNSNIQYNFLFKCPFLKLRSPGSEVNLHFFLFQ